MFLKSINDKFYISLCSNKENKTKKIKRSYTAGPDKTQGMNYYAESQFFTKHCTRNEDLKENPHGDFGWMFFMKPDIEEEEVYLRQRFPRPYANGPDFVKSRILEMVRSIPSSVENCVITLVCRLKHKDFLNLDRYNVIICTGYMLVEDKMANGQDILVSSIMEKFVEELFHEFDEVYDNDGYINVLKVHPSEMGFVKNPYSPLISFEMVLSFTPLEDA